MFVPLSESERRAFFSQTHNSFIPGYTGHCPTLKFQHGRCYGTDTKNIMQRLRDSKVIKDSKIEYRAGDPKGQMVLKPIKRIEDQMRDPIDEIMRREAKYILGYTGYIPGINFRYGKSYGRSADESMNEFNDRLFRQQQELSKYEAYVTSHPITLSTIRSRDEVSRSLQHYLDMTKPKEREISSEYPPIAGYTGHIPRMKGNDVSLSRRFNVAAQEGLSLLRKEKDRRNHLQEAENKIRQILDEHERKFV